MNKENDDFCFRNNFGSDGKTRSKLVRSTESMQNDEIETGYENVENNANCIIQVYGKNSLAIDDDDDLVEYASESSDNEHVNPNFNGCDDCNMLETSSDSTSQNLIKNVNVLIDYDNVDNNTNCIIHVYGQNSVAINDDDDLVEYAESSDDDRVFNGMDDPQVPETDLNSNNLIQNDKVPTDHDNIIRVYGRNSFTIYDEEDLIDIAAPSDDDEVVVENAYTNTIDSALISTSTINNNGTGESNTQLLVFGRNFFNINDGEDLVECSDDENEVAIPIDALGDESGNLSSDTIEIDDVIEEPSEIGGTPMVYKGRPKRGRKRKIPQQSRADRKRLYNTNKKHVNSKGNVVDERIFDENFVCQCSKKCSNVVSLEQRKRLFNQFWSMGSFAGRCAILINCVSEAPKKRSYSKRPMRNRVFSRKFFMYGHNVCKIALLRTLQINQKRIDLALIKKKFFDTFADCRGIASGGRNAYPVSKRIEVRAHISSFPKYISHYTRTQTDSKFLSSCLNLAKMYSLYKFESEEPVSKSFYKRVFYEDFNLRFKKPKKDTCLKCDTFAVLVRSPMLSGTDRLILEEFHNEHLQQAESLRAQMNNDLQLAKIDDTLEVLPFDFQKILSAPRLTTSIVYYKRQLNLYNFGLHVGSTGKGIFHVWLETEASKGTQEVGSCLKKYISAVNGPTKLILWSDSCGGQNRSIKLILMLIHILQNHPILDSISIRYLQSGHSFLPNDSEFGDFECALKGAGQLYTDVQFIEIMQNCRTRNQFEVRRMSSQDFFSVKTLEKEITNRKIDLNKNKINWLDTHEILIEKSRPGIIKMRKTIDGPFQSINIEKRNGDISTIGTIELDQLWPDGRPLSQEKIDDLKEILKLVPEEYKYFYAFLDTTRIGNFIDDIDGFGETIDFEIEE